MQIEVKTPDLGEGVEAAQVVSVMVAPGQQIQIDQSILELETDKAVAEVPSPVAGRVVAVHVKAGDEIATDTPLLTVDTAESPVQSVGPDEQAAPPAPSHKVPAAEIARQGHQADAPEPAQAGPRTTEGPQIMAPRPQVEAEIPAGPDARRLARELGVDLATVKGSGRDGRVQAQDVMAAAHAVLSQATQTSAVATPPAAAPAAARQPAKVAAGEADDYGPIRREPLTKIRKTIAEQMARSYTILPHVTNFDEADITELERFRAANKEALGAQGVKLTLLPFVVRAVAEALKAHPLLNATLDLGNGVILFKEYCNIGIAVDSERGLVVPVLRDAGCLSIVEIGRELSAIADKARHATFAVADLRGGTFTISNLGAVGGQYSTPIINYPESAVLLVGRSKKRPVVMGDGGIEARLILPLSLSYDHRLIDGAEASRFLNRVIEHLESPAKLLLD